MVFVKLLCINPELKHEESHYSLKAYSTCPPQMQIISLAVVEPAIPCGTWNCHKAVRKEKESWVNSSFF